MASLRKHKETRRDERGRAMGARRDAAQCKNAQSEASQAAQAAQASRAAQAAQAAQTSRFDPRRAFAVFAALVLVCALAAAPVVLTGCSGSSSDAASTSDSAAASADGTDSASSDSSSNEVNVNQLPDSSFLYDTEISELASADSFHDGQTVQVRGEAVGELVTAEGDPENCWLSLQEQNVANPTVISVYLSYEKAQVIDGFGSFGKTGATVQVRGTYNLDCSQHLGLSDIHAEEVTVVERASDTPVAVNAGVALAAAFALIGGVLLLVGYRFMSDEAR